MILTEAILEQGKSIHGGWNELQFMVLGIKDFIKGWKRNIMDKDLPEHAINEFLRLKDLHLRNTKEYKILKKNHAFI